MRTWSPTAFILLATLAGCDPLELVETSYPDRAAAASGGSVSRGWIPGWLPADASDIREIHNLDTNQSALAFDTPRDLSWAPPAECRTIEASVVVHSRYRQEWWPSLDELRRAYSFYECPGAEPYGYTYVGIRGDGGRVVHWRVAGSRL